MTSSVLVQKFWNYYNVFWGDGMSYGQDATVRSLWIILQGEAFRDSPRVMFFSKEQISLVYLVERNQIVEQNKPEQPDEPNQPSA